ncbi:MAG: metal-dependent phosphohydrolase [Planctomycetota bacterium]
MTSYDHAPTIMTASGRIVEFLDPQPDQIDVDDIAHALAMQCRFGGHTREFYSIAEHSVYVSLACDKADALYGLLHDASEAYLVDVPKPIKQRLPDYQAIETPLQRAIYARFGLSEETPASVKEADRRALVTEGRDLCAPEWEFYRLPWEPYPEKISRGRPPWPAWWLFTRRFDELMSDHPHEECPL